LAAGGAGGPLAPGGEGGAFAAGGEGGALADAGEGGPLACGCTLAPRIHCARFSRSPGNKTSRMDPVAVP